MTTTRKIGLAIAVLIALLVGFTIYYFMPRATLATVTGTEVKRMDQKDTATGGEKTRDVRFLYAKDAKTKEARVFRNEDNPWYFKFDSGDIAAEAAKLAGNDVEETALIKYYGVRMPLFHAYPNVIGLEEVPSDYVYVPWVSMIILVVLLVLFLWVGVKVRKMLRAAKDRFSNRPAAS